MTHLVSVALVGAVLLTGCGGDDPTATSEGSTSAGESSTSTSADAAAEVSAEHNDADTAFAQGMLPHHRQAVEMSDLILAKADTDERVLTLAERIAAAQAPEIEQMTGFLEVWGEQVPQDEPPMGEGMASGMNGMMSAQDMMGLRDAEGVDAARLFLQQMTMHHAGAVQMARTELDVGQNPQALELAQQIADSQEAEMTEMQEILGTL